MITKKFTHPGIAALAAIAISFSACNKKSAADSASDNKKSPPAGAAPNASASVAEQIKGYWVIDEAGMLARLNDEAEEADSKMGAAELAVATQLFTQ